MHAQLFNLFVLLNCYVLGEIGIILLVFGILSLSVSLFRSKEVRDMQHLTSRFKVSIMLKQQ
ncbi:hypothetical protein BVRB_7g158580 [Beta vulgaris subsp. vulgaris]|nr:hypothetical protein BVRB_7g158580 [Beta vulgaris subsp. vulgaris]